MMGREQVAGVLQRLFETQEFLIVDYMLADEFRYDSPVSLPQRPAGSWDVLARTCRLLRIREGSGETIQAFDESPDCRHTRLVYQLRTCKRTHERACQQNGITQLQQRDLPSP